MCQCNAIKAFLFHRILSSFFFLFFSLSILTLQTDPDYVRRMTNSYKTRRVMHVYYWAVCTTVRVNIKMFLLLHDILQPLAASRCGIIRRDDWPFVSPSVQSTTIGREVIFHLADVTEQRCLQPAAVCSRHQPEKTVRFCVPSSSIPRYQVMWIIAGALSISPINSSRTSLYAPSV